MKAIGIDYGQIRIGIAISDKELKFARGYLCLKNNEKLLIVLNKILNKEDIGIIVIGYPCDKEHNISTNCRRINSLIYKLRSNPAKVKVIKWEEVFTSKIAKSNLAVKRTLGLNNRKNGIIDMESARIILQEYLDSIS